MTDDERFEYVRQATQMLRDAARRLNDAAVHAAYANARGSSDYLRHALDSIDIAQMLHLPKALDAIESLILEIKDAE